MKLRFQLLISLSSLAVLYFFVNCGGPTHTAEGVLQQLSDNSPPQPPQNLMATAVSSQQIDLNWQDQSLDELGFRVELSASSTGPFTEVGTTSFDAVQFQITGLTPNTTYYFRVLAFNSGGNSAYTAVANATTLPIPTTAPTAPTNLIASPQSGVEIKLTWTDSSNNETAFLLERSSIAAGPFASLANIPANQTSFIDDNLPPLTTYYYRLKAMNDAGSSSFTAVAFAATLGPLPNAPASPIASGTSQEGILVSWTDLSNDEAGFKIERATSSLGPFYVVGTLGPNTTQFQDAGLNAGTAYFYRVYSYSSSGNSPSTSVVSARTWGTFTYVNVNIIQPKCIPCHTTGAGAKRYPMSNYSSIMGRVVPGNALASPLYTDVVNGSMPKNAAPLNSAQLEAIRTWIDSGAANN